MGIFKRKTEEERRSAAISKLRSIIGEELFTEEINAARERIVSSFEDKFAKAASKLSESKLAEPGHRYTAAWGEISQRVAQRQSLVASYTTLAAALLSVSYLANDAAKAGLVYTIGPLSLAFALLLGMHERQIAVLRSFLARIEMLDDCAPAGSLRYPLFYAPGHQRSHVAHCLRMLHDWVSYGLVMNLGVMAGFVIYTRWWSSRWSGVNPHDFCLIVVATLCWCAAIFYISRNSRARGKIFRELVDLN